MLPLMYPLPLALIILAVVFTMLDRANKLSKLMIRRFFTIVGIGLLSSNLVFPLLGMFLALGPIIITASVVCFIYREGLS